MSAYLLDTNILSEIRKGPLRANQATYQWWLSMRNEEVFLSVMTLGEIRKGIDRLRAKDISQSLILDRWFEEIKTTFASHLLEITPNIAECWGQLQAVRPLPDVDALIAATAIQHDLILVTRNEGDFTGLGLHIVNPFNIQE